MPIFHDYHARRPAVSASGLPNWEEEMSRTEDEDEQRNSRPYLKETLSGHGVRAGVPQAEVVATAGNQDGAQRGFSREELIERIKRKASPTWQAQQSFPGFPEGQILPMYPTRSVSPSPLFPAVELSKMSNGSEVSEDGQAQKAGLEIERPKSALHSGDFRSESDRSSSNSYQESLSTSPVVPWHRSFPRSELSRKNNETKYPFAAPSSYGARSTRSRAMSQSGLPSSFIFLPPTSPLVQQTNNADLDFSPKVPTRANSRSPERANRRHTFSPHSFQTYKSSSFNNYELNQSPPAARAPSMRREGTFPYQAHQPRRSLSIAMNMTPNSTPQSPFLHPRRPSVSDLSPLHHAPMVGSYEESILRGRMSTTPSRPLDFVAQIGVLGKGTCKSNLRCPPHVTIPFPAVFYSYATGNGRISDNEPSPYVGLIDLENGLEPAEDPEKGRRRRRHHTSSDNEEQNFALEIKNMKDEVRAKAERRKKEKMKRRSTSPKTPPGGSYRIPQQGQLQIVIKNPNKTAVKLFLVPYDLSDMEAGQKTFIRQRSYSAGPIIDMPLASRNNLGTDRPEASLSYSDDPNDRPILRYLIHLNICCPSKGRYYLHKAIRVVFANRVPDGKEKLRNEVQFPDPRFGTYKPARDPTPQCQALFANSPPGKSRRHGVASRPKLDLQTDPDAVTQTRIPFSHFSFNLDPIPFQLPRLATVPSRPESRQDMDVDGESPGGSGEGHRRGGNGETSKRTSPVSPLTRSEDRGAWSGSGAAGRSGLLAQRLRERHVDGS